VSAADGLRTGQRPEARTRPRTSGRAAMSRPTRVLFSARDVWQAMFAADALVGDHHVVRSCLRTTGLPNHVASFRPDVVVIGFPVGHGSSITAVVKCLNASFRPLVLCTVEGGAEERAAVLEAGADAYLHEPFTAEDLVLHVRALARRVPWLDHGVIQIGGLVIDESAHLAVYEDQHLDIAGKEFEVLARLANHAGTVVSKRALLESLWGVDAYDENLVEVHVSALRRRLPDSARAMVKTVRGVGYVLRHDPPVEQPSA